MREETKTRAYRLGLEEAVNSIHNHKPKPENPYKHPHFRRLWDKGFDNTYANLKKILEEMKPKPTFIECPYCNQETMGRDIQSQTQECGFYCENCGRFLKDEELTQFEGNRVNS